MLTVDDCADRQIVKHFCAVFPGIGISILPVDLIIKSVNSRNLSESSKRVP